MVVNQISLKERLERINKGYPSDPAFNVSAVQSLADLPINIYLNAFPEKLKRLSKIIGCTEEEMSQLSYSDIAVKVYVLWNSPRHKLFACKSLEILSLPLRKCYEERKNAY